MDSNSSVLFSVWYFQKPLQNYKFATSYSNIIFMTERTNLWYLQIKPVYSFLKLSMASDQYLDMSLLKEVHHNSHRSGQGGGWCFPGLASYSRKQLMLAPVHQNFRFSMS